MSGETDLTRRGARELRIETDHCPIGGRRRGQDSGNDGLETLANENVATGGMESLAGA